MLVLLAVVLMCGSDQFIYDFMREALTKYHMVDEYMYLSIRTVNDDVLHPWSIKDGDNPSETTLKAFENLIQVN